MSPIAPLLRQPARRAFSLISTMRSVARAAEPHPFARLPKTQVSAKADYGRIVGNVGNSALLFLPLGGTFCIWPLVAEKVVNGHV